MKLISLMRCKGKVQLTITYEDKTRWKDRYKILEDMRKELDMKRRGIDLMECKSCRKVLAYNKDGLCNKCKEVGKC